MTSEHRNMEELMSKKRWSDIFEKDVRMGMGNNNSSILSVSTRDLTRPFRGGTRLILSSLGALALGGYKTTHLYLTAKKPREPYTITVTHGKRKASINIIEVFGGENSRISWFKYNKLVNGAVDKLYEKPDVLICERRPVFMLCSKLSKYLKTPWILRIDALYSFCAVERARYTSDVNPLLKAPFAIASYVLMAKYADYGICVTKTLEKKLRHLLVKNITTVEPTHLTISEGDARVDRFELGKDAADKDYVIISSKDYRIIKLIASRAPDLRYIIIGEHPHRRIIEESPENIAWTGTISDQKLIQLYENALCTIIYRPWISGVSMALLETLHYGRPCIINSAAVNLTNGYNNIEGALVTDDVFTWPTLLKKFQNDKSFKSRLEIAARRFFDKKFSPEVHVAKMKHAVDIVKKL